MLLLLTLSPPPPLHLLLYPHLVLPLPSISSTLTLPPLPSISSSTLTLSSSSPSCSPGLGDVCGRGSGQVYRRLQLQQRAARASAGGGPHQAGRHPGGNPPVFQPGEVGPVLPGPWSDPDRLQPAGLPRQTLVGSIQVTFVHHTAR